MIVVLSLNTANVKPFHFYYATDGNEVGDIANNGFCLEFFQLKGTNDAEATIEKLIG